MSTPGTSAMVDTRSDAAGLRAVSAGAFAQRAGDGPIAKDSWRGWPVAAAAFVGLLLNVGVLVVYSFGVLTSAMASEFGWTPVQRSSLFVSFSLSATVAGLLWATLADKIGARKTVVASNVMLALSFASLAGLQGDLLSAHLVFATIGLVGAGTLPPTYASFVVGWFDRRRGLALGIAMVGVGAGAALLPPIAGLIVSLHGWRATCMSFGGALVVLALPACLLFLHPHPDRTAPRSGDHARMGLIVKAAFREVRTWILVLFAFLSGAILVAGVTNLVPLLQARGETLQRAAQYQACVGIALVLGRLTAGWLFDRFFAPRVATAILLVTAAGFLVLHEAGSAGAYIVATIGIGLAIGMEVDFLGFVASRYFDKSAFTTLFGLLFASYSLGATIGPPLFATLVHTSGGYALPLQTCAGLMLLLSLTMFALPHYPQTEA